MTIKEKFNDLRTRLSTLKANNAISENRYLAAQTILQQAEQFAGMENPPGLQLDSIVIQSLDSAENLIKAAEGKSS